MFKELSNKIRYSIAATAILLVAVMGYVVSIEISHAGKIAVTVTALPKDAMIRIDGQKVDPGTIYLDAGSHKVAASKDGFDSIETTRYISHDKNTVGIALNPVSAEALQWANEHQNEYLRLEGKAGEVANKEGERFNDKNPIINLLPYENFLYTIGYRDDPSDPSDNSIIIEIDAVEGYRQTALYQIYQWGYDPTDFKINFRNYTNPFSL